MERIQDFILPEKQEEEVVEETEKKVVPVKKNTHVFKIIAKTNTDVVIERTTPRTRMVLAVIPSKGQYYIMEGEGDNQQVSQLTSASWVKFFLKLEEDLVVDLDWIKTFEKSKSFADTLLNFLAQYREPIMAGLIDYSYAGRYSIPDIVHVYEKMPKLAMYLAKKEKEVTFVDPIYQRYSEFQPLACGAFDKREDSLLYLYPLAELFGIDKVRDWVQRFMDRDINFSCKIYDFCRLMEMFYGNAWPRQAYSRYGRQALTDEMSQISSLNKENHTAHIDPDALTTYALTFQAEGYDSLSSFFSELCDDWQMQKKVLGEIREKYPSNLTSHHKKMILKHAMISDKYNAEQFEKNYQEFKKRNWKNAEYIIKAPKNIGEMVDEAQQQSNCLRTYINSVVEGSVAIYFLRRRCAEDVSLTTIEVRNDEVVQIKNKFNKTPNATQKKVIAEWAQKKGLRCNY